MYLIKIIKNSKSLKKKTKLDLFFTLYDYSYDRLNKEKSLNGDGGFSIKSLSRHRFYNFFELFLNIGSKKQKTMSDILSSLKFSVNTRNFNKNVNTVYLTGEDLKYDIDTVEENPNLLTNTDYIFFENSEWSPI